MQDIDTRIKVFASTGPCLLDIEQVVEKWNKNTFITRYCDEYTFVETDADGKRLLKLRIYTEQAKEIIKQLNLQKEQNLLFNSATWHS